MATILPLNKGQHAAAEGYFDFLLSDEKEMRISGPAGTGKSFLLGHMMGGIMTRYEQMCSMLGLKPEYSEIINTATTNKAADVLSLATGFPAKTIHSHMNLKVMDDYKTGQSKVTKSRSWKVHEKQIVIIDEAYTLDSHVYKFIGEGTFKSKIIYVGDKCQLGPVMEAESPIARLDGRIYDLDEQMRTGDPDLEALFDQLRNQVLTGTFGDIKIIPGKVDLYDGPRMEQALRQGEFINNPSARILAYTNDQVIAFNDFVRNIRGLPKEYTHGEVLVNNTGMQMRDRMVSAEEELEIFAISNHPHDVDVGAGVPFMVYDVSLRNKFGDVFDCQLPADRDHFYSLLNWFKREKNWVNFYDMKNTFPDLRPRDASTVHKAQGSTYDTVYIDITDLSTCKSPALFSRLLYVAASRARIRIVFYGHLAERFGKFI